MAADNTKYRSNAGYGMHIPAVRQRAGRNLLRPDFSLAKMDQKRVRVPSPTEPFTILNSRLQICTSTPIRRVPTFAVRGHWKSSTSISSEDRRSSCPQTTNRSSGETQKAPSTFCPSVATVVTVPLPGSRSRMVYGSGMK